MEKSVEGGSAEEACRAATIGESLNQDGSEIEASSLDAGRGGRPGAAAREAADLVDGALQLAHRAVDALEQRHACLGELHPPSVTGEERQADGGGCDKRYFGVRRLPGLPGLPDCAIVL